MATTRQQLIRDITQLFKTRGLRLAMLGSSGGSDHLNIYTHVSGNLAAPAGTTFRIVVDMSQTLLDAMGEKAVGAENSVIPVPDRV